MPHPDTSAVLADIADRVLDATEETFILFSQDLPHNDLGILDPATQQLEVHVAGRDFSIRQSPALLRSTREAGTTGAVMWKITPLLADWLASPNTTLWTQGILTNASNVVELGCGSAGLIGMALAPFTSTYILTDQDYVMKLVKENLAMNMQSMRSTKKKQSIRKGHDEDGAKLKTLSFDWETDSVQNIQNMLQPDTVVDQVILCDCIYNFYLIEPLVQTCRDICLMNPSRSTCVLIAQQLRADDVFEQWLQALMKHFQVWRMKDEVLPSTLNSASGYVIHLAILVPAN